MKLISFIISVLAITSIVLAAPTTPSISQQKVSDLIEDMTESIVGINTMLLLIRLPDATSSVPNTAQLFQRLMTKQTTSIQQLGAIPGLDESGISATQTIGQHLSAFQSGFTNITVGVKNNETELFRSNAANMLSIWCQNLLTPFANLITSAAKAVQLDQLSFPPGVFTTCPLMVQSGAPTYPLLKEAPPDQV